MASSVTLNVWDLSGQMAAAERLRKSGDEKAQLEHAAKGFEQVMIRKMLEVARESSWDPKTGEQKSYQTMGDDQLAAAISNMGGFGMADALVKQMMGQIQAARHGQAALSGKPQAAAIDAAAPLNAQPISTVKSLNN
jgi:Rod binding domain-containing protein